jgi:hypothetical protein
MASLEPLAKALNGWTVSGLPVAEIVPRVSETETSAAV